MDGTPRVLAKRARKLCGEFYRESWMHSIPPGNRLEQLSGKGSGQHRIRVNDQYRICFTWEDGGLENVEVTDYHDE